jgi:excisionase family DNA binding protein
VFLQDHLDEPELTEATVRAWIAHKKIRAYRFGRQYTAKPEELVEDLAGKAA